MKNLYDEIYGKPFLEYIKEILAYSVFDWIVMLFTFLSMAGLK